MYECGHERERALNPTRGKKRPAGGGIGGWPLPALPASEDLGKKAIDGGTGKEPRRLSSGSAVAATYGRGYGGRRSVEWLTIAPSFVMCSIAASEETALEMTMVVGARPLLLLLLPNGWEGANRNSRLASSAAALAAADAVAAMVGDGPLVVPPPSRPPSKTPHASITAIDEGRPTIVKEPAEAVTTRPFAAPSPSAPSEDDEEEEEEEGRKLAAERVNTTDKRAVVALAHEREPPSAAAPS